MPVSQPFPIGTIVLTPRHRLAEVTGYSLDRVFADLRYVGLDDRDIVRLRVGLLKLPPGRG
jgi:hypothetical protein